MLALMVSGLLVLGASSAGAGTPPNGVDVVWESAQDAELDGPFVDVIKVDGLLDPIMVDFIHQSIVASESQGSVGLVLQVDSDGVAVDDDVLSALLDQIDRSAVPVAVWVGPSGSTASLGAALLGGVAPTFAMAPGTSWGLDGDPAPVELVDARRPVPSGLISAGEATDAGLTSFEAPTIGDLIVGLPGVETRQVEGDDGQPRLEPITPVRFGQLSLGSSLMHAMASPAVAYLLFFSGMALLVFELFTAGVGVAGIIGAGSFVAGCYGMVVLPTRWWAIALIVVSMVAFAVDVQTGVPRFWTAAGFVMFTVGSLFLYDGVAMSWITLVVGLVAVLLIYLGGMPSMVRTRFSLPTLGREWMIGEMGRAVTAVDPDGVVRVRDSLWRATTNRATPLEELDKVRVTGIDGLVLEVEPETGAARDYRERRRPTEGG
jgi:membrane-bound serine protease (ClpP class)